MFAHFQGRVCEKTPTSLVIDCAGVGYLLHVSLQTLTQTPPIGETAKCFCSLQVREGSMELFGFATQEEKTIFERLILVSGVGPRTALGVLSSMSTSDLVLAIVTGDAAALKRAPGIGLKTAQRIILDLKEKITKEEVASGVSLPQEYSPQGGSGAVSEAIEALIVLGYAPAEASRAVSAVRDHTSQQSANELIRLALQGMDGSR